MIAAGIAVAQRSLPSLEGRLLWAYRISWCALAAAGIAAAVLAVAAGVAPGAVLAARLVKTFVVGAAAVLLLLRRPRDPVAAILALAFLCWIVTSSFDFTSSAMLPALLDRLRFLLFALALLLFPDGRWVPSWTRFIAAASGATFGLGVIESLGLIGTRLFLPVAILCIFGAIAALVQRYRAVTDEVQEQQLKWVAWGLVVGVGSILAARGAAATSAGPAPAFEILFQFGIIVIAMGFLVPLVRYRLYDAETVISRSAALAGLTGALVATFAGSEALIETLGQQFLGAGMNNVSAAIAAAVAVVMLTPLHGRISAWAEARFQADLVELRTELPELLADMPFDWSPEQVGAAALPRIAGAIHSSWIELYYDGRPIAMLRQDAAGESAVSSDEALRLSLHCPYGGERGALSIGARPDGTSYGKDERNALNVILAPLRRRLIAAERQAKNWPARTNCKRALESAVVA
jgi:hypothetical protein